MKTISLATVSSLVLAMATTAPVFAGEQYGEGHETKAYETGKESSMQQMQHEGMAGKHTWKVEKNVEDITGNKVVNTDGEEIGKIDKIVEGENGDLFAVISVGGFLGIGAKDVTLPLDRMQMKDETLQAPLASKEELDKKSSYDAAQYQEVPGERMVGINTTGSETMEMPMGEHDASFSKLDSNDNGYLSRQEAKQSSDLSDHWSSADSNSDDKIDRAEFSAFEIRNTGQSSEDMHSGETDKSESTGSYRKGGSDTSGY